MILYSQHLQPELVKTTLSIQQDHSETVDLTAFTLLDGKCANVNSF